MAGLVLLLVLGTLSFRLREAGIDRTTIGYLSWVGLAYGFKWVWAPLVDRLPIPLLTRWLGRRRSWLLLSQCLVVAGLVIYFVARPLRLGVGRYKKEGRGRESRRSTEDDPRREVDKHLLINDTERLMLLEALAGMYARSADTAEVTACMRLAQRLEGFTIDGRPGLTS